MVWACPTSGARKLRLRLGGDPADDEYPRQAAADALGDVQSPDLVKLGLVSTGPAATPPAPVRVDNQLGHYIIINTAAMRHGKFVCGAAISDHGAEN
jgi:hypothetical protein